MTDRENLFSLMKQCKTPVWDRFFSDSEMLQLADHLIAHGVMVKGPQKPLTVEEATGTLDIVWFEQKHGYATHPCDAVIAIDCVNVSMATIGYSLRTLRPIKDYGKTWRCWAEKPTDEERMAAEWEK